MLTLYDEFAGWGGSSQGATAVPGVDLVLAANHAKIAIDVHSLNYPKAEHYLGDVTKADLTRFGRADLEGVFLHLAESSAETISDARVVP